MLLNYWAEFILRWLRADVWNYRESGVGREISNFFIFCLSNLYNEVFKKNNIESFNSFLFFSKSSKDLKYGVSACSFE